MELAARVRLCRFVTRSMPSSATLPQWRDWRERCCCVSTRSRAQLRLRHCVVATVGVDVSILRVAAQRHGGAWTLRRTVEHAAVVDRRRRHRQFRVPIASSTSTSSRFKVVGVARVLVVVAVGCSARRHRLRNDVALSQLALLRVLLYKCVRVQQVVACAFNVVDTLWRRCASQTSLRTNRFGRLECCEQVAEK